MTKHRKHEGVRRLQFTFPIICGRMPLKHFKAPVMPFSIKGLDFSKLSGAERILLAQDLWDSARSEAEALPLTPEQHTEIQRRVAELDAGKMTTYSWQEVKQRLLNRK